MICGHRRLHAKRQFIVGDQSFDLPGHRWPLSVLPVERLDQVELLALLAGFSRWLPRFGMTALAIGISAEPMAVP